MAVATLLLAAAALLLASYLWIPRAASAGLPRFIQTALDSAEVQPGRWHYIVLHHSATKGGTMRAMDRYHRQTRHMENGLAYHFVIGNGTGIGDGTIRVGHRWTEQLQGGHLANEEQNQVALGICLVGDFDKQQPSVAQMQSLQVLVQALLKRCQLEPSAVKLHREFNLKPTECPGTNFPAASFFQALQKGAR
jgi:N-acetyl-anhydromuramyl-L-alanine amidase AmpD